MYLHQAADLEADRAPDHLDALKNCEPDWFYDYSVPDVPLSTPIIDVPMFGKCPKTYSELGSKYLSRVPDE